MTRMSTRLAAALAVAGLASIGAATTGSADDTDAPSFSEFKADTYRDADGQYIVNGDIPVSGTGELRDFYDSMFATPESDPDALIVNTVYGKDDVWSAEQAKNLTYCVSSDFGGEHGRIAQAMEAGGNQWENATAGIDFTYVAAEDGNCNTGNTNVTFSVEPVTGASYIARAFFPSSAKAERNVLVNTDQIFSSGWSAENVMAHELGHALGFRHEHTRPEAGTCFEDNNWRPLTPYDSASIMHYPQCNGSSQDLTMSAADRSGVKSVYPG